MVINLSKKRRNKLYGIWKDVWKKKKLLCCNAHHSISEEKGKKKVKKKCILRHVQTVQF